QLPGLLPRIQLPGPHKLHCLFLAPHRLQTSCRPWSFGKVFAKTNLASCQRTEGVIYLFSSPLCLSPAFVHWPLITDYFPRIFTTSGRKRLPFRPQLCNILTRPLMRARCP